MSLEFKIIEKEAGKLAINFEEFKAGLEVQLEQFKNFVVSEDAITNAKATRAGLNKVEKTIDDRRKELKKEFLKPYEVVDAQAKILIGMINEVKDNIDSQIKVFEESEKEAKKNEVIDLWGAKDYKKVSLEHIWSDKWLNKTVTLKQVEKEIDDAIVKIESDLNSIKVLVIGDEEKVLALQSKYLVNLDLQRVLYDYQQEQERKKYLENIKQVVKEKGTIKVEEPKTVEVETKQSFNVDNFYILRFEVTATEEDIMKLSKFLKENNYNYKQLGGKNE